MNKYHPDPNQWLFDRVEQQREDPSTHLLVIDRINMGFTRDAPRRPMLRVQIQYLNRSVFPLEVTPAQGWVHHQVGADRERLPEMVIAIGGRNSVPAGGQGVAQFEIPIPLEYRDAICDEEDTCYGEIRSIRLDEVAITVRVAESNQPERRWGRGSTMWG